MKDSDFDITPGMVLSGISRGEFDIVLDVSSESVFLFCGENGVIAARFWHTDVKVLKKCILENDTICLVQ